METMTQDDVQLENVLPALKSCPLFQALKDEHFEQILKIFFVFAGKWIGRPVATSECIHEGIERTPDHHKERVSYRIAFAAA